MPAPFGTDTSLFKNERLSEEVQLLDLDLSASLGQLLLDVLSLSLGDSLSVLPSHTFGVTYN